MAIKRSFEEDGEETTVKFEFTGREKLSEIAKIIDDGIEEALNHQETEEDKRLAEYALKVMALSKGIEQTIERYRDAGDAV